MFFLISPSPLSLPAKSCSRWGDRAQHAATGSPGNLCPPSKNMFWPSVPHLEGYLLLKPFFSAATWHNTLDRFYLHTLQKQNIFCTNETKKKRSYVAIVSGILMREAIWHCQKTGVALSLVLQLKNKGLLYGSYKCTVTDTLKTVLASTLHNGSHCNKRVQNNSVRVIALFWWCCSILQNILLSILLTQINSLITAACTTVTS